MNRLPKIKIGTITDEDLRKIKEKNIDKCRILYKSFPIATKVWIALKTKLPYEFISKNWEEITSEYMKNTLEVEILQVDFAKATNFISNTNCPLACALKRMFPSTFIYVRANDIEIEDHQFKIDSKEWGRYGGLFDANAIDHYIREAKKGEQVPTAKLNLTKIY